jgi:hypothetical protein
MDGTPRGYLYLSDSNYDRGQGVPDLQRWQRSRGLSRIAVFYFGTDPRINDETLFAITPQDFSLASLSAIARRERLRYLAVGTTVVYGSYEPAAVLRKWTPVDRTQTFLIYDLNQLATNAPPASLPQPLR